MPTRQTALVVLVPEAEPVVAEHRRRLDSGAWLGVPAHVTVLYPFRPAHLIDADTIDGLASLCALQPAFDASFESVEWFGDQVAYLAPTPDEPFHRLTEAVWRRWPDHPPYDGQIAEPIPHLTIGDRGRSDRLETAAVDIALQLPVQTRVTRIHLMSGTDEMGSWAEWAAFDLG
jgi:hypothetical protein